MSPPRTCGIDEIGPFWKEEQIIAFVRSIQNASPGASLPCDVTTDINPYMQQPWNLPDGIWYVVYFEDPKQSEFGSWKIKGDPIQVYSDSSITGCRTTLEFHEGRLPKCIRTDWVMQEYSISLNGSIDAKGGSSICRVFLADQQGESEKPDLPQPNEDKPSENKALQAENDQGDIQLLLADYLSDGDDFMELDDLIDAKGGSSIGRVDLPRTNEKNMPLENNKLQVAIERLQAVLPYQGDNLYHGDYFSDGDFLELDDLVDRQTSSSSSGNSSCITPSSDMYFDPGALPKQLGKNLSSYQCAVSRPNDIVLTVVPEGSPAKVEVEVSEAGLAVESKHLEKKPTPKETTPQPPPPPPVVHDVGASTSRQMSRGSKGKKVHRGKTIMKFLCFMGF